MVCRKCGAMFKNANSWGLCIVCYSEYERRIPPHIPEEQHVKYLYKTIREIHEI
jgi:protein-arginine kinase activator protein McsA